MNNKRRGAETFPVHFQHKDSHMAKTLIKNVDVITLDEKSTILRNSSIAMEGKTILAVGETPPGFAPDETIDGYNHVALPAFFNAHCHAAMTYERGWAEDLPFPRWLNEKIWVAESALTPDDVYWGAALAACEMIRGGVAAFNEDKFTAGEVDADKVLHTRDLAGLATGAVSPQNSPCAISKIML